MLNSAKILIAVFCFVLFLPAFVIAGEWRKQNSGTLAWLHSIYFLDSTRGWIAGSNGTLLQTIDGGATWKSVPEKPTDDNLRDVFFADEQNGWLLVERDFHKLKSAADSRSYLLQTIDGGANWERAEFPIFGKTAAPQMTKFIISNDRKTVWAVGEVGSAYRLQNDAAWQKQMSPTRYLLRGGAFFNDREGTIVGAGATILNTNDGGKIWREAIFAGGAATGAHFNSIFFLERKNGWAVGADGKVFATANGGKIWRVQNSNSKSDLFDIRFVTPNEGWIVGDGGTLLHTTTGGASWAREKLNSAHRLERIFFTDSSRGWAIGFGGTILSYSKTETAKPVLRGSNKF